MKTLRDLRLAIEREAGLAPIEPTGQQLMSAIIGDTRPKSVSELSKEIIAERRAMVTKVRHRIHSFDRLPKPSEQPWWLKD